jgi:hypothetical protein
MMNAIFIKRSYSSAFATVNKQTSMPALKELSGSYKLFVRPPPESVALLFGRKV